MSELDSRNFANNLAPLQLDGRNLEQALRELQAAITASIEIIKQNSSGAWGGKHDSLYTGDSGVALMYLRLSQQLPSPSLPAAKLLELAAVHHPYPEFRMLGASRLSPIGSSVGPAVVELTRQLITSPIEDDESEKLWKTAASTLQQAIELAAEFESVEERSGATEVLYGQAGLLWAILNLRQLLDVVGVNFKENKYFKAFSRLVDAQAIRELIDQLVSAGQSGKAKFEHQHRVEGIPLMWDGTDIVRPHMPIILATIQDLVQLASNTSGHLPSSLPAKIHSHHHVQICHGSPGLLLLLSTLKSCFPENWDEELYARGMQMAAEKVWEEGLVKKGLGLCHGVTGNAWPLLLLGDDKNLSRGLAFLLHATQLPPLSSSSNYPYRTPDHPWSLFEGLAGAVCAWADACVILEEKLQKPTKAKVLGMPGLGGLGAIGIL